MLSVCDEDALDNCQQLSGHKCCSFTCQLLFLHFAAILLFKTLSSLRIVGDFYMCRIIENLVYFFIVPISPLSPDTYLCTVWDCFGVIVLRIIDPIITCQIFVDTCVHVLASFVDLIHPVWRCWYQVRVFMFECILLWCVLLVLSISRVELM